MISRIVTEYPDIDIQILTIKWLLADIQMWNWNGFDILSDQYIWIVMFDARLLFNITEEMCFLARWQSGIYRRYIGVSTVNAEPVWWCTESF